MKEAEKRLSEKKKVRTKIMMKKETLKTNANANAIANAVLQFSEVCEMYSLTRANFNVAVETSSNKLFTVNEEQELANEIISTMNLDSHFDKAVKRCEFYIDNKTYTCYIGAVYTALSSLATIEQTQRDRLNELFNKSLDKEYNKRVLKGHELLSTTETRHKFESIDEYIEFMTLMLTSVVARKKALLTSENKEQKKEQKEQKQKKETKSRKQKKTDISTISVNEIAELTKEIVEAEMQKA